MSLALLYKQGLTPIAAPFLAAVTAVADRGESTGGRRAQAWAAEAAVGAGAEAPGDVGAEDPGTLLLQQELDGTGRCV